MKSLSKEEIYEKHTGTNMELQYIPTPKENVLDMMDEYAKQQSIEFAKWHESEGFTKIYSSDDDYDGMWYDEYSEGINRHYYTSDQLYKLFEQHKTNNQ